MVGGQKWDPVFLPSQGGCRGAADMFSARSWVPLIIVPLEMCRLSPCPLWDPHQGCSAPELCSVLQTSSREMSAATHPVPPRLSARWRDEVIPGGPGAGGRSSHGDRQRFTRRGRVGASSFLFFSSGVGQPAKELKERWHSLAGESARTSLVLQTAQTPPKRCPPRTLVLPHR